MAHTGCDALITQTEFLGGQSINDKYISAAAIAMDAAAAHRVAAMHRSEKNGRIGAAASAVFDIYPLMLSCLSTMPARLRKITGLKRRVSDALV